MKYLKYQVCIPPPRCVISALIFDQSRRAIAAVVYERISSVKLPLWNTIQILRMTNQ